MNTWIEQDSILFGCLNTLNVPGDCVQKFDYCNVKLYTADERNEMQKIVEDSTNLVVILLYYDILVFPDS